MATWKVGTNGKKTYVDGYFAVVFRHGVPVMTPPEDGGSIKLSATGYNLRDTLQSAVEKVDNEIKQELGISGEVKVFSWQAAGVYTYDWASPEIARIAKGIPKKRAEFSVHLYGFGSLHDLRGELRKPPYWPSPDRHLAHYKLTNRRGLVKI